MKYLLLICVEEGIQPDPEHTDPMPWVEEMEGRGVRLLGNRLRPISDATTVTRQKGELLISDGPFAETKEQIAGFDIIDCADLDEAIEVAGKHPVTHFGTIEIRPFWPE
jgi:hypothetical protein